MKKVLVPMLLVLLAISEVASTGILYDEFGLWSLVAIYCVTTLIGVSILMTQSKYMKAISRETTNRSKDGKLSEELEASLENESRSDSVQEWGLLVGQGFIYTVAWILVLIPGLVTDAASYIAIGIWFKRFKRVEHML